MVWNEKCILSIVADLSEENPFACKALYAITEVTFTKDVPTLAVSLTSKPTLYINNEFLNEQASSEDDVKALLLHEFLHVVLMHTEKYDFMTPMLNVALDAIINSIIHRTYGTIYSDFFKRFYKNEGIESLLRPIDQKEFDFSNEWHQHNRHIYSGKYAADDLFDLLQYLQNKNGMVVELFLIGNHSSQKTVISKENVDLLKQLLKKMNGTGIWSNQHLYGESDLKVKETQRIENMNLAIWKKDTCRILEKCLLPDKTHKAKMISRALLPILSSGDRKAFATFRNSPFVPFSEMSLQKPEHQSTVNVYFDVSGSMEAELKELIALLYHFREHIRKPLWVFSNKVEQAKWKNGHFEFQTTNGTCISCVFDHIRERKSQKNLIITDGFVEQIDKKMIEGVNQKDLWVLISSKGNGNIFAKNRIQYFQLKSLKP